MAGPRHGAADVSLQSVFRGPDNEHQMLPARKKRKEGREQKLNHAEIAAAAKLGRHAVSSTNAHSLTNSGAGQAP